MARPALGDQERATLARHRGSEGTGVHQAHPFGQRIDTEDGPGQVQEGEGGVQGHLHPVVGAQEVDRALGHQRGAGHRVDDGLRGRQACRRHQSLDDPGVDLVERRRSLVQVIEGGHTREASGRRVAGRPEKGPACSRRRLQLCSRVDPQELGARRPEAHHGHVGATLWHAQPVVGVDAAPVPLFPVPDVAAPVLPAAVLPVAAPVLPVPVVPVLVLPAPVVPVPVLPVPVVPEPVDDEPRPAPDEADAGAVTGSTGRLADALSTSDGGGVNGVSTDPLTGTQTPYCGFTLTDDRRSSASSTFWVTVEPACWTTLATAAFALLYGVGVREVICSNT